MPKAKVVKEPEVEVKVDLKVCLACNSKNIVPDIGSGHGRCHDCDKHWDIEVSEE